MAEVLGGTLAGIALIGGVVSWFVLAINMFRVVSNRKEGIPLFPNWYESPFNILFRPKQLTQRGLLARRKCFYGVVAFVVFALIGLIAGTILDNS